MPTQAQPASAGLFIVNPLSGVGGLTALFSTHPPMAERVRRLRAKAQNVQPRPLVRRALQAGW